MDLIILVLVVLSVLVALGVGVLVMLKNFYRKVDQGKVLIVSKMRGDPEVTFSGGVVLPIVHRGEVMDISVKTIEIARSGKDGLICADNIRADIKVTFFVRVNKTEEDVLKVAQTIGCERASTHQALEELFVAKFSEALKTVGKKLEFVQLYTQRDDFKDQIIQVIGRDLNGYVLDDAAIDYLEQTPLASLDSDNILDAEGIRKITRITASENQATNDLRQKERMELTRQNLEADEAILELERRRADAEAKQQREIATVKAREAAETAKVQSEEHQRAELARIRAEEEIQVNELNKQRQVEVAEKDRERVVAIKAEQVHRDRDLEMISREREVDVQRIDKEMEVEVKRKEIADVVRTRVVVDKSVAEEEERIKDLRVTAEARRHKDVAVIGAEAEAEQGLVKELKAAEAAEKAAEFNARQRITVANAELEAADRIAKSKARLAEGVQAEEAASGLARVRVIEAEAIALEKTGTAEARIEESQGMARMAVREREIDLDVKKARETLMAEAEGRESEAETIRKIGEAEASATRERMTAEADGLSKKLAAMKAMEGAARDHEEFRLRLEHERGLAGQAMAVQKDIAEAQSKVLAEAFGNADIRVVGGDGEFFDKLVKAASMGAAVDGFVEHSGVAQQFLGSAAAADVGTKVLDAVNSFAGNKQTVSQALAKLTESVQDEAKRTKLNALIDKARELGLD